MIIELTRQEKNKSVNPILAQRSPIDLSQRCEETCPGPQHCYAHLAQMYLFIRGEIRS